MIMNHVQRLTHATTETLHMQRRNKDSLSDFSMALSVTRDTVYNIPQAIATLLEKDYSSAQVTIVFKK